MVQTAEQALDDDLSLIANDQGWTLDEAHAYHAALEAVQRAAQKLAEVKPDAFVGSAISGPPGTPGTLYIKGKADSTLQNLLQREARGKIHIVDKQPFSFADLQDRHGRIVQALTARGYEQVGVSSDIRNRGRANVVVRRTAKLPSVAQDVARLLPGDVRDVAVTVQDDELGQDQSFSGGGMWMRIGANNSCHASWSVRQESSPWATGVTSAGHCSNSQDGVRHHATTHAATFQADQYNWVGDMEWYTTNAVEDARWYASNSTIREATSVAQNSDFTVGAFVCNYSNQRTTPSDGRHCASQIQAFPYSSTVNNVTFSVLVQMDECITVPGDSGSGWSYNTKAFGILKGCGGGGSTWTPALYLEGSLGLGVEVITN